MDMRHPYIFCLLIKPIFEAHRQKQAAEYVVLSLKSFAICPCADSVHSKFERLAKEQLQWKTILLPPNIHSISFVVVFWNLFDFSGCDHHAWFLLWVDGFEYAMTVIMGSIKDFFGPRTSFSGVIKSIQYTQLTNERAASPADHRRESYWISPKASYFRALNRAPFHIKALLSVCFSRTHVFGKEWPLLRNEHQFALHGPPHPPSVCADWAWSDTAVAIWRDHMERCGNLKARSYSASY